MPRRTKIIFIVVFILVGAIMLGYYYSRTSTNSGTPTDNTSSDYSSFNPFGTSTPTQTGDGTVTTNPDLESGIGNQFPIMASNRFHKITEFGVAGGVFFEDTRPLPVIETPSSTTKITTPKFEIVPAIRYVEKATGHIYEMFLDTKVEGKVSNSTIPNIYEAMFDGKAQSVIYRYLSADNKTITTFMATLGQAKGEFLPDNITDVAVSPDKTKFFYLTKTLTGSTGTTKIFGDTKATRIFTSSFSEWLPQWVTNTKIFLTTKPAASVEGSTYSMNTTNGTLTKIFGGIKGLATLANNDGSLILYSEATILGPSLKVFSVASHGSLDLGVYGLPEKCVWASDNSSVYCALPNEIAGNQYPDIWYQGLVSFTDHFVRINMNTLESTPIATSETPIDATHLFLDKGESNLFFINKRDATLWALDLK
jgi:hypothetical protein